MSESNARQFPPPIVAVASWLVPGLGYVLIGQRTRGLIAGTTILLTFLAGLLIGGIRVIDVPGYDIDGSRRMNGESWRLQSEPATEILNKPWYIAQAMTGPMNMIATWGSRLAAEKEIRASTARIFDIGTLYTAVAGMLNLLVIIDVTYRAAHPHEHTHEEEEQAGPEKTPAAPPADSLSRETKEEGAAV